MPNSTKKSTTRRPRAAQPSTNDLTQAAMALRNARALLRSHPHLVTAPVMPEPYLSACIEEYGTSPEIATAAEYHFA